MSQQKLPGLVSIDKNSGNEEVREMVDDYIRKVCKDFVVRDGHMDDKRESARPPGEEVSGSKTG